MDETEIRQRIIEFQNVGRTVSLFTAFPDICCCYACAYLCKCIPDWLMGVPHQWKISSIPHHKPVVYYRQTPPESERGKDSHWWVGTNRVFRCCCFPSFVIDKKQFSSRKRFLKERTDKYANGMTDFAVSSNLVVEESAATETLSGHEPIWF